MQIVSYGGGTNSTAMLIEMVMRGEPCVAVVFADTGGERPETYEHVVVFSEWLTAHGYPAITTVRNDGMHGTLEAECMTNKRLPSIAFGFASCSDKYKRRPFQKWLKSQGWQYVTCCIGFDADEPHRAARGKAPATHTGSAIRSLSGTWGATSALRRSVRQVFRCPARAPVFSARRASRAKCWS